MQAHEVKRILNYLNVKETSFKAHYIKSVKNYNKERIFQGRWEKRMVTYKGIPIGLSTGFSAETLQAREDWNDILKILKDKNCEPIPYPAKLLFRYEGEINVFPNKS